jgi:hypothetical protein
MPFVIPHRPREHHYLYRKQHGHGIGSFLKGALSKTVTVAKSGLKSVGKVVKATGKAVGKAAVTHLAPIAKTALHHAKDAAIQVGQQALTSAVEGGKQIVADHGLRLVDAISNAKSAEDVRNAFRDTAQNVAGDTKSLAKSVVEETKANAKQAAKEVAINAVKLTLGLPTEPETELVAADELDESPDGILEGAGVKKKRGRKPPNLSKMLAKADLQAGKARPRGWKLKGGAAFLPGTAASYVQ